VSAFVRVYQRANRTPVSTDVVTTITDSADRQVRQVTDTLDAARFAGSPRAADVVFELPLQTLSSGEYVLTFEATAGRASARRDVRFRVR
jgi:hypothetical protein